MVAAASDAAALFDTLWRGYVDAAPAAAQIHAALTARGERVVNDHIALRTFDLEAIGLERLAAPFVALGYAPTGRYRFEGKRLNAMSFSSPRPGEPRVFISELETAAFSPALREAAHAFAGEVTAFGPAAADWLAAFGRYRPAPWATVEALGAESEYAAWLLTFGLRANHFTVSVNALQTLEGLEALNDFIESLGHPLSRAGGAIKGGPAQLLAQSSTLAERRAIRFRCGAVAEVPTCYVEFALRYPDPATGALFDRFVEGSADRLFESTHRAPAPR